MQKVPEVKQDPLDQPEKKVLPVRQDQLAIPEHREKKGTKVHREDEVEEEQKEFW